MNIHVEVSGCVDWVGVVGVGRGGILVSLGLRW